MSGWEQVVENARLEPSFASDSPLEFSLVYEWTDPTGIRGQRVWVRWFEAYGEAMVEVRSAVGPADVIPAGEALAANLELPLGALALHDQMLVVIQKLPLTPMSVEGVLFVMRRVSMVADMIEARLGGDRY